MRSVGMDMPTVNNVLVDEEGGVRYEVLAYRRLSREELVMSVRFYHVNRKSRRKLKKGTVIQIVSVIGCEERR